MSNLLGCGNWTKSGSLTYWMVIIGQTLAVIFIGYPVTVNGQLWLSDLLCGGS